MVSSEAAVVVSASVVVSAAVSVLLSVTADVVSASAVLLAEFPQAVIEAAITNDIIIASFFFIINSSNLFPIGDIAFERILIPDYKVYKKSSKIS